MKWREKMGNVSRMSGSAWHVDVLKSKDKRRDKRKCKFMIEKIKFVNMNILGILCYHALHQ